MRSASRPAGTRLAPAFLGEAVTLRHAPARIELERLRPMADLQLTARHDELVAVAEHILRWVPSR